MDEQFNEKEIFDVARRIDSADARIAYLKQVCGDNHSLFDRITALVRIHDQQRGFLATAASGMAPTLDVAPIAEEPGTKIGRYKLVHEIGHGGMGVVYMAVQKEPVKRKVALKIIKPGMDTREVVTRFEGERQALALMDHQSIAKVLDGGSTESGRPYFVMELVEGTKITEFCDEARYNTRQRLELFGQVCGAVQHAHQKGIIHRDLKPSNILVTNYDHVAVPKVIDFGIAKAVHQPLTDHSVYTNVSQMIGTPLYMSPEQAQRSGLDIDTRTDVYSLGVLLYELLSGTTPFEKDRLQNSSLDEVKRIIREEDPPRPSTRLSTLNAAQETVAERHSTNLRALSHELSGELDWIVMKALEKDRNRRYESASDFAKDLQRHLDDEPVEACPPSKVYRFGKFARRNRTGLVTTALVVLALIVGTGVALWQAIRANAQAALAAQATSQAEAESERARDNLVTALDAVDEFSTQIVESYLAVLPHSESIKREIQQKAIRFYQMFTVKNEHDPTLRRETAKAYHRLGRLRWQSNEFSSAILAYRKCITVLRDLDTEAPSPREDYLFDLAIGEADLGLVLWRVGRITEAEQVLPDAIITLERLVREFPENPGYQWALADTEARLALCHCTSHQSTQFEYWARKSLARKLRLIAKPPQGDGDWSNLSNSYQNLGVHYRHKGNIEVAIQCFQEAIRWRRHALDQVPESSSYRSRLATSYTDYAGLLQLREPKDLSQQIASTYVEAIEVADPLVEKFPDNPAYLRSYIRLLCEYSQFITVNEITEEEGTLSPPIEEREQQLGELLKQLTAKSARPWQFGWAHGQHARLLNILGSPDDAIRKWRTSMPLLKQAIVSQPEDPTRGKEYAIWSLGLAFTLFEHGRDDEANDVLRQAADALWDSPNGLNRLAWMLACPPNIEFQRLSLSIKFATRVVELAPDDEEHWNAQTFWNTLGYAQYRSGDYKAAAESLTRAVELPYGDDVYNHVFLAMSYWQLGDEPAAFRFYQQAVEWTEKNGLTDHLRDDFIAEAARMLGTDVVPNRRKPSGSETDEIPVVREPDLPQAVRTSRPRQ